MTAQAERYVLIRAAGRGDYRVYHRLAADDSSPACGAPIQHDHWIMVNESRARRSTNDHAIARRCCAHCAKQSSIGGNHGNP